MRNIDKYYKITVVYVNADVWIYIFEDVKIVLWYSDTKNSKISSV